MSVLGVGHQGGIHLLDGLLGDALPQVLAALPLGALGVFGATSRAGCVAVECTPVQAFFGHLEAYAAIRVACQEIDCLVPVRDALRFWLPRARALGPPDRRWTVGDVGELAACQAMAEEASELLKDLDGAEQGGVWNALSPLSPAPTRPLSMQHVAFHFAAGDLAALAGVAGINGRASSNCFDSFDGAPRTSTEALSAVESLRVYVAGAERMIPCVLRLQLDMPPSTADGAPLWRPAWSLSIEVRLSAARLPALPGGVRIAVVVYFFSACAHWHVKGTRCVSHATSDGETELLPANGAPAGRLAWRQLEHLLICGEVQAVCVANVVEYTS
eukprot:TRINITY_DN13909_c0_g3_i1.p1 TRINITY_DN13909_c0_g3~~TRINITY_DN13909_c0_g3_i1.p1  ORF type:complete len:330 (+),score=65.55 TRINITY_DN13909_c0_g3_i1:245-1234(+)